PRELEAPARDKGNGTAAPRGAGNAFEDDGGGGELGHARRRGSVATVASRSPLDTCTWRGVTRASPARQCLWSTTGVPDAEVADHRGEQRRARRRHRTTMIRQRTDGQLGVREHAVERDDRIERG